MTAVKTEDTIRVEPYGDYRNIFTILHHARALGDASVAPLLAKLMDTDAAFIKALSNFLTTAQHDLNHNEVIQFIGSVLKSNHNTPPQFQSAVQPLLDHYPRMCNSLPEGRQYPGWDKLCGFIIRSLSSYPANITDDITTEQAGLLFDASVSILLIEAPGHPARDLVAQQHKIPDALAELILAHADKEETIHRLLRSGNARLVEIESVLNGETPLPLSDGVL